MAIGLLMVLVGVVALVGLVAQVVALVDAVRRRDGELADRGGKTLWVALLAISLVVPGGFVLALVYLLAVRPRSRALPA